jgi:hypothetical protein
MAESRPTPFDLVFAELAEEKFAPIAESVRQAGVDPWDRDAVLMARPMIELIHELRPESGLGEAIDEFVALLHAALVFWRDGARTVRLAGPALTRLLAGDRPTPRRDAPVAYYIQYPPRRLWGAPVPGEAHEPLDGCFVLRSGSTLTAVGVFGLHPARQGFAVVTVSGPRPSKLVRADGSPLFAPALPGGEAAGLHSVTGMEELLELAWRGEVVIDGRGPAPGLTEIG